MNDSRPLELRLCFFTGCRDAVLAYMYSYVYLYAYGPRYLATRCHMVHTLRLCVNSILPIELACMLTSQEPEHLYLTGLWVSRTALVFATPTNDGFDVCSICFNPVNEIYKTRCAYAILSP